RGLVPAVGPHRSWISTAISAVVSPPTRPAARVSRATPISCRASPPPSLMPVSEPAGGAAASDNGAEDGGRDGAGSDDSAGGGHCRDSGTGDGNGAGGCPVDGCPGSVCSSARVISSVPCNIPGPSPSAPARPRRGRPTQCNLRVAQRESCLRNDLALASVRHAQKARSFSACCIYDSQGCNAEAKMRSSGDYHAQ